VAIINEATARKVFPGESAVGKRVATDSGPTGTQWLTIVGVVGDIHHEGLNVAPRPEYYIHSLQAPPSSPQVMVRTAGDTAQLQTALRGLVRTMDSDIPIQFANMDDVRAESVAQPRFQMLLMATFAGVALLLAVIGIYGVMAYSVTQRVHEIGIRMALGAQQGDVLRLVIRQGMWIAAIGIAVGTVGALAAARLLRSMLFDVTPTDPATFAAIAALLAAAALLACYVPARRAARVDPMVALRYE
jgi:putative ABC transport system permease protein